MDSVPDIVVHGHTHEYCVKEEGGVLFINPGSAGPARFKLPRTAAVLELQPKVCLLTPYTYLRLPKHWRVGLLTV